MHLTPFRTIKQPKKSEQNKQNKKGMPGSLGRADTRPPHAVAPGTHQIRTPGHQPVAEKSRTGRA